MTSNWTVDTCTWINLASGSYPNNDEILSKFEEMIYSHKVTLLLPQIIIDEWERNKIPTILEAISATIAGKVKQFRQIRDYLSGDEVTKLQDVIQAITSNENYFKAASEERIKRIERLFAYKTTYIIPIIDEIKIKAAELALNNVKPFAPKKNSMGDALIFLSATEFMRGVTVPFFFVTDNKTDFGAQDATKLHDDLVQLASDVFVVRETREIRLQFNYFNNIGSALNAISNNAIDRETELAIEDRRPHYEYLQNHQIQCKKCNTILADKNNGSWKPSMYGGGLSWWLICHQCGTAYDTGNFLD